MADGIFKKPGDDDTDGGLPTATSPSPIQRPDAQPSTAASVGGGNTPAASGYAPDDRPGLLRYLDAQNVRNNPIGPPTADEQTRRAAAYIPTPAIPGITKGDDAFRMTPEERAWASSVNPAIQRPDPNAPPGAAATAVQPPAAGAVSRPIGAAAAAIPAMVAAPTAVADSGTTAVAAPGTAIINGRSVSADEIKRLANTNVIPASSFANPGMGVALSEATGGRVVPELGSAITMPRPTADPIRSAYEAALADQQDATRTAQSRMADVASRDWRSAAGIQAGNAAKDLQWAKRTGDGLDRKLALEEYNGRISGLLGGGLAPAEETAKLAGQYQRDVGEQQRGLAAATERAQTAAIEREIRRPQVQVPMADGSLGLLGSDGVVRPALDAGGKPVRTAKAPDVENAKTAVERQQQLAKTTEQILQNEELQRKPGTAPLTVAQARMRAYQIHGAVPPANEWISAARELNPKLSDKDLAAQYSKRFSQQ